MDVDVGVLSLVQLPIILYTPDTAYSFVQYFSGEMMGWIFERMYICCKTYLLGQIVEIELPKEGVLPLPLRKVFGVLSYKMAICFFSFMANIMNRNFAF